MAGSGGPSVREMQCSHAKVSVSVSLCYELEAKAEINLQQRRMRGNWRYR